MINSLNNQKIIELNKLKQKKYQEERRCFLVEGLHLVNEAKEQGLLIEAFSLKEEEGFTQVSAPVLKKLSQTTGDVDYVGVCHMPSNKKLSDKILILDDIKDPTNLGTILRSAKAFGFNTVIASNETVSFFNDKVVRGSQGAIFKLNLINANLGDKIQELISLGYSIYGTNVRNGIDIKEVKETSKIALMMGNETRGLKEEYQNLAKANLYIKLDDMESLNVSVCASIMMYELKQKREL